MHSTKLEARHTPRRTPRTNSDPFVPAPPDRPSPNPPASRPPRRNEAQRYANLAPGLLRRRPGVHGPLGLPPRLGRRPSPPAVPRLPRFGRRLAFRLLGPLHGPAHGPLHPPQRPCPFAQHVE